MARDTNFYYSFLVLPAEKRRAIVSVWDFCRAVDDAVDEMSADQAPGEIARWRRELAACFDGAAPATRQGAALVPFIGRFGLPRDSFDALIDGVEMDVGSRRYETFEELSEYCVRVASAVGIICLSIFGCRDERSRQYATDLGIALQLTNILRDVRVDLARGRVYVPQAEMRRFGVTEADLQAEADAAGSGLRSPSVRALLASQAARAREYYRRAAAGLPAADARRLVAAEIMGAIYKAILAEVERSGYDVFSRVVRIPRPRRALIAARTWVRVAVGA
jgi:phytoene synthase